MRSYLVCAPVGFACFFPLLLAACGDGAGSGKPGGAAGSAAAAAGSAPLGGQGSGGAGGAAPSASGSGNGLSGDGQGQAGSFTNGGIVGTAGTTASAGNAAAGGNAAGGGGTGGAGGTNGGAAGASGNAGSGNTTPQGVMVTTHDITVPSGSVFNVADDYFNDGLVPPTPVANFGCQSQITTIANDDGSLDVAWLDYAGGKGKPWALPTPGMIYVSHVDAALGAATTTATGISSYKLLGFTKDADGNAYVAYNKDHALKNSTQGDQNNTNGNELHVAKVGGWDTLIFGNQDNNADASLGDPGGAASGVLGYDSTNQKLVIYVGHSMMWTPTRHQAGFLRLLNPTSGAVIAPPGNDIVHFGAGWWYSHNFNQRLVIDGGNYYVLAHGDAFPRQLGFARWSVAAYSAKNETDFNEAYWKIDGNEGDNNTNAQTGQFVRISAERFVIVHTSSQGRTARDVRVVTANASSGVADTDKAVWLTQNQGTLQATMPKVELLGGRILVTYATWDSSKKHALTWYGSLLDATSLATVTQPEVLAGVEFVDAAPLFRFKGGKDAGKVGWVSGNAAHTLSVHVVGTR